MTEFIYLDNHATTPCDPLVVEEMLPYFSEVFANSSSTTHRGGRQAAEAVDKARQQVADLIGARAGEVVFTSGATESNNLAITGLARGHTGNCRRIVTTAIEHKAVLEPCQWLESDGFETVIVPVDCRGRVDLEELREAVNENTLLVSVQAANNEIGTLQEISEIASIAHYKGSLFHCDAAQAAGRTPIDVEEWGIDFLSLSAHKLYGPKGVGALYVRGGPYAHPVRPLSTGGGQERQLRAGTLNVPGIVGMGKACELSLDLIGEEPLRIEKLRDELESRIVSATPGVKVNGDLQWRLPGNSNLTFPGIDAEALIVNLPSIGLSTGSACTVGAQEPSHVLTAVGLSREEASASIRVGIGRFNQQDEIEQAVVEIWKAYGRLISLSL